ncbi:replication factor C large subunit [archaeon]|nr:replication factor C large subunit [archaeon]
MQWSQKYDPKNIDGIAGNPSAVKALKTWASDWNYKKKPLLLVGTPGTTKTTSTLALAQTFEWELLEMNSSDLRNKKNIERIAGLASVSATFSGNKRLILFDEVDGMFRQDFGGSRAVLEIVKHSRNPVILTANDAYAKNLASIRKYCEVIKFKKIHYSTIKNRLAQICDSEGIQYDETALLELAKRQSGDLKAAINDLQAIAQGSEKVSISSLEVLGARDKTESIFNALRTIFKKKSFGEAREAFDECEENPDLFMHWIDENIPREYQGEALAKAFEHLAKASLYAGRITRRQNWKLMKYQIALMSSGVSLVDSSEGYTQYQFPSFIRKLGASRGKRATQKSLADKVGKRIHAGRKEVIQFYLPFLRELFKKDPQGFAELFKLDEKESALLSDQNP